MNDSHGNRVNRWAGLAISAALAMVLLLIAASPASALQQELLAPDGDADDNFGFSSAIDGDMLVIGAPGANNSQGAVYVYERSGASWLNTGILTASDGASPDRLGYSVAIDGDHDRRRRRHR